jgi:hypothetical protein
VIFMGFFYQWIEWHRMRDIYGVFLSVD